MERNHYLDFARGIGIMIVVFAHAIQVQMVDAFDSKLWTIIMTFEMPMLMMISGYAFALKPISRESISKDIKRKCKRLLVPYLVWSELKFVLICLASHESWSLSGNMLFLLTSGVWFLRILFVIYIIVYLSIWGGYRDNSIKSNCLTALCIIVLALAIGFIPGYSAVIHYLPCFVVGIVFNWLLIGKRYKVINTIVGLSLVAFMSSIFLYYKCTGILQTVIDKSMALTGSITVSAIAVLLCKLLQKNNKTDRINRIVEYIGACTLPIYVIHTCILTDFVKMLIIRDAVAHVYLSAALIALVWLFICIFADRILRKNSVIHSFMFGTRVKNN